MTITDVQSLYGPVAKPLGRVQRRLMKASQVDDFPFLSELLDYTLDWSGKHIRPALTLLAAESHIPVTQPIENMALAVEMLHIATLVHDDAVDDASVRRGRDTVSSRWGKSVALLVGDYLFAKSATIVTDTGNLKVIRLFAETTMAVAAGELREYENTFSPKQTLEDYWRRIEGKTASLFMTAAACGAILSASPERQVVALQEYGRNLGMAFQIADDILDFEGNETAVGKPLGVDLTHGVMTLPAILLSERYPTEHAVSVAFDNLQDPDRVQAAVDMVRNSPIIGEAARIAKSFSEKACDALKAIPESSARQALLDLAQYVVSREQ